MTETEKKYKEKYKKCSEVSLEECFIGGKNCGTCAHRAQWDSNFNYFENDYCTCAKGDG